MPDTRIGESLVWSLLPTVKSVGKYIIWDVLVFDIDTGPNINIGASLNWRKEEYKDYFDTFPSSILSQTLHSESEASDMPN